METNPSPRRRPINPQVLDAHVARKKLKAAKILHEEEQPVTLSPDEFIPVIRAEVGSPVALAVFNYRILIPIAHTIRESTEAYRRVTVANRDDLDILSGMFIRHFGGVTLHVLDPSPVRGIGARNPQKPLESLEENEHAIYEVYAGPVQESDDYFRALRQELQDALGEGVILIERREVLLL